MSQVGKPHNAKPGQKGSPKKSSLAALVLGNRKVKSNETKQAEEKRRKAAKERRASKDVASYIGYDAVYKDGIAQVEEGLFSQTIEFSDVSYQSARKETQENIFTVLSGLYNYFGADTSVELTIANTPIPHDEIGNKRFFEHSSEKTRPIVDEYNRILNDKMREASPTSSGIATSPTWWEPTTLTRRCRSLPAYARTHPPRCRASGATLPCLTARSACGSSTRS